MFSLRFVNSKSKNCKSFEMRSRADQLDRKNQANAAFYERLKENHLRSYIEALETFKKLQFKCSDR